MSAAAIDDLLRLLSRGWSPYHGRVECHVYASLGCNKTGRARWMMQGGKFICLGCGKRCSLVDPAGFELMLPVTIRAKTLAYANLPAVSAEELLRVRMLLTVPEVEFVLNVSKRTVYALLDEGRLERHPAPPTRITAESVRREASRRKEE